jgi:hypothetical protein
LARLPFRVRSPWVARHLQAYYCPSSQDVLDGLDAARYALSVALEHYLQLDPRDETLARRCRIVWPFRHVIALDAINRSARLASLLDDTSTLNGWTEV